MFMFKIACVDFGISLLVAMCDQLNVSGLG